ncbi:MAG: tetratricopeptide repeat protein, partial [Lewinella sp.]|nr:tetratricopeptide repeat protein [Lewinella sp.]
MKMLFRSILCLAFLILSIGYSYGQQNKVDSLTVLLASHPDRDTGRVRIMNSLAYETCISNATLAKPIALDALGLAKSINYVSGQADCYFTLAYIYSFLGERDSAIQAAASCRELSDQLGNIEQEADVNYLLGYLFVAKGDNEKGKEFYQICIDLSQSIDYREGIGKGVKGLGDVLETEGLYGKAREMFQQSLKINQGESNENGTVVSYNDLGRIAEILGDFDKAL